MIFRRAAAGQADQAPVDESALINVPSAEAAKGRPTPKRRDAQAERTALMKPPRDRREAYKMQRAKQAQDRTKTRQALITGDERHLPSRDKGAVRKFVRDFIDSRRTLGEYFMFVGLAIVVFTFIPNTALRTYGVTAWWALLLLFIGEGFWLGFRLRKELDTRFPADAGPHEGRKGAVFYGVMRSFQLRRLRLPKPVVKPGQPVP